MCIRDSDVPVIGPGYEVVGFQQPIVKSQFSNKGRQSGTKSAEEIIMEEPPPSIFDIY